MMKMSIHTYFGIDCVLEVALQGLHDDRERVAERMANKRMRGHIHIWPQLIDEAAALLPRGRYDDLIHHFLDRHGGTVGPHELLAELNQKL